MPSMETVNMAADSVQTKPHSRKSSVVATNGSSDTPAKGSLEQKPTAEKPKETRKERRPSQNATKPAAKPETDSKETTADKKAGQGQGSEEKKLSGAEMKKLKQAEKAARRAQEKSQTTQQPQTGAGQKGPSTDGAKKPGPQQAAGQAKGHHKRSPSQSQGKALPIRLGQGPDKSISSQPKKDIKKVALFGHLYGQPRRSSIVGTSKDVHPAILALGLQIGNYNICGSSARCVATLIAFKAVIQSYTTPPHHSLPRHLTTHLSTQIDYLVSCRPLATSTGNAIRWLKLEISAVDPSEDEGAAKADLCDAIDRFIQERITVADRAIATTAVNNLQDDDTILTFGKSSIVVQTLLTAHNEGKRIKVIVVDSRPLFEGRNTARSLSDAGMDVQYTLTHGLSRVMQGTSKVLLGAHSMLGNGRLYARAGSALVAMTAKMASIPVIVCCESIKFTDRVALDSIVTNEVAPAEELILSGTTGRDGALQSWREKDGLQMLNLMYDITPAEYLTMIVTEYGCLPASSVPVVHRLSTNT